MTKQYKDKLIIISKQLIQIMVDREMVSNVSDYHIKFWVKLHQLLGYISALEDLQTIKQRKEGV